MPYWDINTTKKKKESEPALPEVINKKVVDEKHMTCEVIHVFLTEDDTFKVILLTPGGKTLIMKVQKTDEFINVNWISPAEEKSYAEIVAKRLFTNGYITDDLDNGVWNERLKKTVYKKKFVETNEYEIEFTIKNLYLKKNCFR